MAPFWGIVRHMRQRNVARPCRYFFGAVDRRDLFLTDELGAMTKELGGFEFIPALSGKDASDWTGERGLITEVLDRRIASADGGEAYLCGSPGMIDAAIKVLQAKGFGDHAIFYDKFT